MPFLYSTVLYFALEAAVVDVVVCIDVVDVVVTIVVVDAAAVTQKQEGGN